VGTRVANGAQPIIRGMAELADDGCAGTGVISPPGRPRNSSRHRRSRRPLETPQLCALGGSREQLRCSNLVVQAQALLGGDRQHEGWRRRRGQRQLALKYRVAHGCSSRREGGFGYLIM